ncbi:hypothetical protein EYF80_062045 [Liparis tanakae]|uniref:Uncharacterized protein n=1 Tax=Liparis tanakae TaxID=230148 RepID=A0A4Z2EGC7_9TELE|nr:hypothetical protein EYF80_062045 [Liparis tanakae]
MNPTDKCSVCHIRPVKSCWRPSCVSVSPLCCPLVAAEGIGRIVPLCCPPVAAEGIGRIVRLQMLLSLVARRGSLGLPAPDGRGPPRQLGLLIGRNLQRRQKQQERESNDKRWERPGSPGSSPRWTTRRSLEDQDYMEVSRGPGLHGGL